eukprot:TRINITY_DN688_c0_g1::TRINITY_DN688_c0_g1_i1::g.28796::m.28796 TRINITY_DN688_c0_g1::TRINITY_DN688_c0_g1_i1::g.28796  ORF type:complete len:133 (-),score=32.01,sp/Q5Q995/KTAP2_IXOSC/39.69/5e-19,Keratin_assoc/PF09775.4/1.6e-27 TRINITY_DN688_c0_g1_i1:163-561(-)
MARAEVNPGTSVLLSACLFVLLLSGLVLSSDFLSSTNALQVVAAGLSSFLFVFALTFLSNFEELLGFSGAKWPEVVISLLAAVASASAVHPRCATICGMFSVVQLFFLNRISGEVYSGQPIAAAKAQIKKKK